MNKKLFLVCFFGVLLFGIILRVVPFRNNNFYFTHDQGENAVYVREILHRHQILLRGPETSIEGFYNGPLWYYFVAIGYLFTGGYPMGGKMMMIILNITLTAVLMWKLSRTFSFRFALLIGFLLQIFWPFYDTSRYSFNPFPLVALSFFTILFLIDFFEDKEKSFILAAIPVNLVIHTEIASYPPLLALYIIVGIWGMWNKRLSLQHIIYAFFLSFLFFIPNILYELQTNFSQTLALQKHIQNPSGFLSGRSINHITQEFLTFITQSTIPQNTLISLIVLTILLATLFLWKRKENSAEIFTRRFVILSVALFVLSWAWFSSNKGWHGWHTVYIPPLLFFSILLLMYRLPSLMRFAFFLLILVPQFLLFQQRYTEYFYPSDDPSLLKNELTAIDWIYKQSYGKGFNVYIYIPSVYDYNYQYLFWWYGRKYYGYVPCEYSTYPNTPDLFIPGVKYYQEPKRDCTNLRFLIIEPDKHKELQQQWQQGVEKNTQLLERVHAGKLIVEKRLVKEKK